MKRCKTQLPRQTNNKTNNGFCTILSPASHVHSRVDDAHTQICHWSPIQGQSCDVGCWLCLCSDCMWCQSNKLALSLTTFMGSASGNADQNLHRMKDIPAQWMVDICMVNKHCAKCSNVWSLSIIKVTNRSMCNWCSQEIACSSGKEIHSYTQIES